MADLQNKVVSRITLYPDSSVHNHPAFIYAKQYDTNSRYIVATIKSAEGKIKLSGVAQLNAKKPDGTWCYTAGTINADNTVTIKLPSQLLAAVGNVSCDISIFASADDIGDNSLALLTTSTFFIIVDKSNYDSDAIESSDEYSVVTEGMATFVKYSEEAQAAREDAIAAAEEAQSARSDVLIAAEEAAASEARALEASRQAQQYAEEAKDAAGGGTGTPGDDITERLEALEEQVADLLYEEISITTFSNNVNTVEIGRTIADVQLTWSLNKTPQTLTLDGTTQSVDSSGAQLSALNLTSNKTWTLRATDEKGISKSKTTSVSFYNGVYYGSTSAPSSYDSSFILGLSKALRNSKLTSFSTNAGADQYIYYCLPVRLGQCTFTVGGFTGGFTLVDTIAFTNSYGYTENYYIYKSDNANLGSTAVSVA